MKKLLAIAAFAALCIGLLPTVALSQQVPQSGRSLVYPLENPPTTDTVTQPARFARLELGTFIMQALGLTSAGDGVYAGCSIAPGTGLYVTVGQSVANENCGVYQVVVDDANPIPVGFNPNLPADPTLIAVLALASGTSSPIGPLTAPASNSVYWLVEAQLSSSDTTVASRGFFNPITGSISGNSVNTQRLDVIAYQTKEGAPGASPTKPSADAGWFPIAYIEVAASQTQVHSGDISAGNVFDGFSTGGCGTSCVTSLDSLIGGLTFISSDGSILFTPSGTTIDVRAAVTPGPQNTDPPSPGTGIAITGSYPYTISATAVSGEATCAVVSNTTCTVTGITVPSGDNCQATMESTDSTLAGPYYAPAIHESGGSLSVVMTAFTSGSGNLAAKWRCWV